MKRFIIVTFLMVFLAAAGSCFANPDLPSQSNKADAEAFECAELVPQPPAHACDRTLKGALSFSLVQDELNTISDLNHDGFLHLCLGSSTHIVHPANSNQRELIISRDNTLITGAGIGQTIIENQRSILGYDNSTESIFSIVAAKNVAIRGMTLLTVGSGPWGVFADQGADVSYLSDLQFLNKGYGGAAVIMRSGSRIRHFMNNVALLGIDGSAAADGIRGYEGSRIDDLRDVSFSSSGRFDNSISAGRLSVGCLKNISVSGLNGAMLFAESSHIGEIENLTMQPTHQYANGLVFYNSRLDSLRNSTLQTQRAAIGLNSKSSIGTIRNLAVIGISTQALAISLHQEDKIDFIDGLSVESMGSGIYMAGNSLIREISNFSIATRIDSFYNILIHDSASIGYLKSGLLIAEPGHWITNEDAIGEIIDVHFLPN